MKTRTMYMHTIDGKPASIQRDANGAWLYFVGGRNKAQLRASLGDIREDWHDCTRTVLRDGGDPHAEFKRYGYVLVEVPA